MNDFNRSKLETAIKECVLHAEVARDEHWQADFAGRGSIPDWHRIDFRRSALRGRRPMAG